MDSREFSMKMDRLKELVNEKDYTTALRIVDSIDWNRVKSAGLLALAASVYEENDMLEDAKDKLVLALERSGGGKRILYKLTELAVRSGNLEEAMDYYNEYSVVAPNDPARLLLQYMILKVQHAPYDQLIQCLELYNEYEPDEKWMYELATTYESAGKVQDAVNLCDRLAVMFGNTPYAVKALKLKQRYTKLTEEQRSTLYPNSIAGQGVHYMKEEPGYTVTTAQRSAEPAEESLGDRLARNRIENEDELFEQYLMQLEALVYQPEEEPEEIPHITAANATQEELEALAAGEPVPVERAYPEEKAPEEKAPAEEYAFEPAREPVRVPVAAPVKEPVREPVRVPAAASVTEESFEEKEKPAKRQVNEGFILAEEEYSEQPRKAEAAVEPAAAESEAAAAESVVEPIAEPIAEPEPIRTQSRNAFTVEKPVAEHAQEEKIQNVETRPLPKEKIQSVETKPLPKEKKKTVMGLHLIIEALDEEEGVSIAKKELQVIYQMRGATRNVAKAAAEKLNRLGNMGDVAAKIGDRDLVIMRAGDLDDNVAEQIYNMLTEESERSIVLVDTPEGLDMLEDLIPETFDICDILTDEDAREKDYTAGRSSKEPAQERTLESYRQEEQESYRQEEPEQEIREIPEQPDRTKAKKERNIGLIENGGKLAFKMPKRDDEVMEFDDFAQYCIYYANDKGCSISGKTLLALYEKIEIMEEDGIALTKMAAEDCIEDAADHAEHPGVKGAFRKKYDKEDMLILREEDFIN